MAVIHHTIQKKAVKHGLTMVEHDGRVEAREGDKVWGAHANASKALEAALNKREAERLATLDMKPEDREPVIRARGSSKAETKDDPGPVVTGSIVKPQYRKTYQKNGGTCGDDLALELTAYVKTRKGKKDVTDVAKLKEVAEANGVWDPKYSRLNVGQQRMNVSNKLRKMLKDGERVKVGNRVIKPDFDDE